MNLFNLWLKFIKWLLIISPPIMVIAFLALPVIDSVRPWSVAESELAKNGKDGLTICVGMSSHFYRSGNKRITETQRSYLLLSSRELAFVTETSKSDTTTLSDERSVNLETNKGGFWIVPALVSLLVWLSLRFCIPLLVAKFRSSSAGTYS